MFVGGGLMADDLSDPDFASEWMKRERLQRGWSTTKLAEIARAVAHREGSSMKLTQQSVSGFEQPGRGKRLPEWFRYVRMSFEEGEPRVHEDTAARSELVFIRQVDIRYAMGDGANIEDYPSSTLVPFNLDFVHGMTHAPLEKLFLATGHGDSMEPTLHKHDLVLIDTTENRIGLGDTIWALEYAGSGLIKRLRRVKRNGQVKIAILSDNSAVPTEEADPEDVRIVGKVVWIARRM
jgi:phage repressor protein C with HTH and peptisase S24 domain